MRTIAATVILLVAGHSVADAQDVARICDTYARDAVRFQQQNLETGCGLAGPEWNADFRYHYDWCVNGQNYQTAENWTNWRRERIAQCIDAAGQTQAPSTDVARLCEGYAGNAVAQQRANMEFSCGLTGPQWSADYAYHFNWCIDGNNARLAGGGHAWRVQRLSECHLARTPPESPSRWAGLAGPLSDQIVDHLAQGMQSTTAPLDQIRVKWHKVTPIDITGLIAATRPPAAELEGLERQNQSIIDAARIAPRDLHLPPMIASVVTAPEAGRVEPATTLLIAGSNFGNQPGRVYLRYTEDQREFGPTAKEQLIEVQPFRATWAASWFSNLVLARAPTELPGIRRADRTGELLLVLSDGAQATASVTVGSGHPVVRAVETASGEGWIKPGELFVVLGDNFGERPGKVRLSLAAKGDRRWLRVRGTTSYVYWPVPGSAPAGEAGEVPLTLMEWADSRIVLRAGHPQPGHYTGIATALFVIENVQGREGLFGKLAFGEEIDIKVVSGIKWFDQVAHAKVTPDGSAMLVTHVPDCAGADSGEKGGDRFFVDAPWPEDIEIVRLDFKQIDPENPYTDLDFFVDQVGDLVDAITSGPLGVIMYAVDKILDAIFSGGEGAYYAYVQGEPGGPSWQKTHVVVIGWETSCQFADGKPVMYATSFTIAGSKAALAKY